MMNPSRWIPVAAVLTGLQMTAVLRGAETAATEPSPLVEVFGVVADWKNTPPEPVFRSWNGRFMLTAPDGLSLESKASQAAPSELLMSYRLNPAKGASASVSVQMACAERADKTQQALAFSVSTVEGQKLVNYSASVLGGKPVAPPQNGVLRFEAVSERSLTWSEEMRRAIEAQIASAPKVEESLLTLRCTAEKGRFRCWLNGRFVSEFPLDPEMNPSGTVRVQISAGAEVASIRVRPLPASNPRFEPLSISGHLNAGPAPGFDRSDIRDEDRAVSLDGIPFRFPAPSAEGGDHIDVGQSWARFGALPGYFPANSGTFGGRWISADRMDPARIAMYIPQGRYKALHLVAISDDRDHSVPVVSAQFYRPNAGHPINFTGTAPTLKGDAGKSRPVSVPLGSARNAKLYHVTIPLDPDSFSWFTDLKRIGLEITKQVQYYRAYPDPLEYSWHGAGLPSAVRIYAMTLERVGVDVDIQPGQFGHVWTAPSLPDYTVELRNTTGAATTARLVITTRSHDGQDTTSQEKTVPLPADSAPVKVPVTLKPTRHGLQEMALSCTAGDDTATYRRDFAWLHPDTRDHTTWEGGRGPIFGFWPLDGGHDTPGDCREIPLMAAAGAEATTQNYSNPTALPAARELAEKHHFVSEAAFNHGVMYLNGFVDGFPGAPHFDPAKPEETAKALIEAMKKMKCEPSAISHPTFVQFFPEPNIGMITTGVWPSHYGEDYKLSPDEQRNFDDMLAKFLFAARAVRKEWPDLKLLFPYGDPMNTLVFLKLSPESRELIDGVALDFPGFERLPEQQFLQVALNRMYPIMKDIKQFKKDPFLVVSEGPAVSSKDLDTGQKGQADIMIRDYLLLMGYGVSRFEAGISAWDCANYWGENHYGAGWCNRLPMCTPKLGYVNYATLTRHLNRANFTKYLPTGSTSTFCQQFKHYQTGKLVHVLWTVRGKRPVTVKVPAGASLELYDGNDNVTTLQEKNGTVTFTVDQSPQYLEGLTADAAITLGASDHSDSKPAKDHEEIANLGDGSWKLVAKEDLDYAKNKPLQIERFLGKMSASVVDTSKGQGGPTPPGYVVTGKALAIHLEKQDKDRGVMPFYTTLEPKGPITIPGKASHLGLWVHAASDWGRVVYVLRDDKGEKWISVGAKEEWNCDDIHGWSAFCFDGWRYVRFEMPSSAPYDSYREHGTSWWGSYGGDGIVDLPLKLEKVIVERRPKVVYAADLVDAKPDDVLLAGLNAEYASESDKEDEVVNLSKIRMPLPKGMPELGNPIADLAKTGVGAPTKIQKVADPAHQYDGTRCHVHFDPVPGATKYDVWVSPYADGRGALQLGDGWTESGQLIQGLRPDIEFYAFVLYTDAAGKLSKPSEPLKFTLKDRFGYK